MTKEPISKPYETRKMYFREIFDPKSKELIDKGLVVWFKEPNSFTGENVCEFHVHGSPAVITKIFSALSSFDNIKHAEPGEFSKRFFFNSLSLSFFFEIFSIYRT